MQKKIYTLIKWIFAIAACAFLANKLFTFEYYQELWNTLQFFDLKQFIWLITVLLLLVPNLILEAVKWQLLNKKNELFSLKTSLKAVISGISTGFLTPNRIGEMAGRVLYLSPENRSKGVILSIISGVTMTLTVLCAGIPALTVFLFFTDKILIDNKLTYFSTAIFLTILLLCVYFLLPKFTEKISLHSKYPKVQKFCSHLQKFSTKDLFSIFCVALARYVVFCVQMYCMLRLFKIDIPLIYSVAGICTNYLLITFTPSFSFAEGAIRSSWAAVVFGALGANPISCILAGICIWVINTMLPVLCGTFFILKKKNS
ncbi:MAG: flippase-like domain-containing protein [Paludibacter sp.]|nr:flippase-like domain-containing protein [Paludibacter sp.]